MDHPMVTQIERTGDPKDMKEPEALVVDAFGNEYYEGDILIEIADEVVLKDELTHDMQWLLLKLGGVEITA